MEQSTARYAFPGAKLSLDKDAAGEVRIRRLGVWDKKT
jgi:hypothetical protein